jgi:hypothetical protein
MLSIALRRLAFRPALTLPWASVVLCIASTASAEPLHNDDFKFAVNVPEQTQSSHNAGATGGGIAFDSYRWVATRDNNTTAWMIVVTDYHGAVKNNVEASLNAGLVGMKASLKSKKEITVDGHPGIEGIADAASGRSVRLRYIQVGNRLSQQLYSGSNGSTESPEVNAYLDSFHITQ